MVLYFCIMTSTLKSVNYKNWDSKIENLVSKIHKSEKKLKMKGTILFINFDKKMQNIFKI